MDNITDKEKKKVILNIPVLSIPSKNTLSIEIVNASLNEK